MKISNVHLILAISLFVVTQSVPAEVVEIFSGNGLIGDEDSEITHLIGPADSAFPSAFTPADFDAARSGPNAQIISRNGAWITPATFAAGGGNASAQWISNISSGASNGNTALYSVDFVVPFAAVDTAELDFYWSVDNLLGDATNAGIFLNGTSVPGPTGGNFGGVFSSLDLNVAPLLIGGINTLYVNSIDLGGPGGIIFSASLEFTEGTLVPLPAAVWLFGSALGLLGWRRRKNV